MTMSDQLVRDATMRELDAREADCGNISVRLLWASATDELFVEVIDKTERIVTTLKIPDGVRAKTVFEHPHAWIGHLPTA